MYLIRDACITDIYILARNLRDGDQNEVIGLGFDSAATSYIVRRGDTLWKNPNPLRIRSPAMALRQSFRHAVIRRTAIIDNQIAAVFGLGGSMLSDVGYPWLLTTPVIEKLPVSFIKEGRKQAMEMLHKRRRLEGHVAADYRQACRFLEALGFTLGEPEEFGPLKAKFRKFTMER